MACSHFQSACTVWVCGLVSRSHLLSVQVIFKAADAKKQTNEGYDHGARVDKRRSLKYSVSRGAWVAQSVRGRTLDFSSGHDLTVRGFKPSVRLCIDSVEPAWDSLSLPLPCSLSLCVSK